MTRTVLQTAARWMGGTMLVAFVGLGVMSALPSPARSLPPLPCGNGSIECDSANDWVPDGFCISIFSGLFRFCGTYTSYYEEVTDFTITLPG